MEMKVLTITNLLDGDKDVAFSHTAHDFSDYNGHVEFVAMYEGVSVLINPSSLKVGLDAIRASISKLGCHIHLRYCLWYMRDLQQRLREGIVLKNVNMHMLFCSTNDTIAI